MLALAIPMYIFYEAVDRDRLGLQPSEAQEGRQGRAGRRVLDPEEPRRRRRRPTTSSSTGSSSTPSPRSTRVESVLVAAPTGSGKTVVAEHAVARALADGRQGLLHDAHQGAVEPEVPRPRRAATAPTTVGLLTGDNAINGDAPVVVMTTEVLRNMIYAGRRRARRPALRGARRGPLPPGRLPGPGVGGGHHPPPARRCASCACRPRCRTPTSWPTGSPTVRGPTDDGASRTSARSSWSTSTSSATAPASELHLDPDAGRRPAQPRGRPLRRRPARDRRPRAGRAGAGSPRPAGSRSSTLLDERGPAAGHLLHLQPGRVRRRRRRRASTPGCG